jgi:hypothetical protein
MRSFRKSANLFAMATALVVGSLVLRADTAEPSATGTWTWSVSFGDQSIETTLKLKQDGEKVTGTITGFQGNENEIKDGTFKDGKVTFKVTREAFGGTNTTTYNLTLNGDSLKGKSETISTREIDAKRAAAK